MPVFTLAAMGVMAGLSAMSASQQNSAAKKQAKLSGIALGKNLVNQEVALFDRQIDQSRKSRTAVGQASVAFGARSGFAISDTIADVVGDATLDANALTRQRENAREAAEAGASNIAAEAESRMKNVGIALVEGGIQGYQLGSSIDQALANSSALSKTAASNSQLNGVRIAAATQATRTSMLQSNVLRQQLGQFIQKPMFNYWQAAGGR